MPSQLNKLTVRYSEEKKISDRLIIVAKRKNRSATQQALYYIEKGLAGDELSQEQQIVVEEMKREMIKKMFR
jgi:regulator of RNase E activity RraB